MKRKFAGDSESGNSAPRETKKRRLMDYAINNLSRRYYALLIIAYLAFIGVASFYFSGDIASIDTALDRAFFSGRRFRFNLHNLRDISTNILLYMPLGFLLAMTIACKNNLKAFSVHLGWGLLLSISVETIQAFIGRYSDITDIVSNAMGYIIGFQIARLSIRRFALSPPALLGMIPASDVEQLNNIAGIRFVYVTIAFISNLLPLNITVSLSDIYAKLSVVNGAMPRLILDPFYHWHNAQESLQYLVLNLLAFLPLAFLSTFIQIRRRQPGMLSPAAHCLVFGVALEVSNVFIRSGRTDIVIPLMGFGVGLIVSCLMTRPGFTGQQQRHLSSRKYFILNSILLYSISLLAVSLSPYEFEISVQALKSKLLNASNFTPFMAHFSSRSIGAAIDIVRETLLYAPLGALLATGLSTANRLSIRERVTLAALLGGTFAISMELLQLMVVGRYVDVTDCLLATVGSAGGAVISPLFNTRGSKNDEDLCRSNDG